MSITIAQQKLQPQDFQYCSPDTDIGNPLNSLTWFRRPMKVHYFPTSITSGDNEGCSSNSPVWLAVAGPTCKIETRHHNGTISENHHRVFSQRRVFWLIGQECLLEMLANIFRFRDQCLAARAEEECVSGVKPLKPLPLRFPKAATGD